MKSLKEIGELLRNTRQKKGLSVEKVYQLTRIQPSIIVALEDGKADESLNKIYLTLFIKQYASFLGLDGAGLAADYKSFYTGAEKQLFNVAEKPLVLKIEPQKWIIAGVSVGLVLIFIFFIIFIGGKITYSRRERKSAILKSATHAPAKKIEKPKPITLSIPKNKPIELVLQSTDDAWMKVKKDGKIAFEGTLRKNEKKEWSADKNMELWVGRAEVLEFTINGTTLGKIGKGNIKNISITREGLKVKDKWLFKGK